MNLSSGKIDKYEYLTGEEILPSNQKQMIKQAKYTYSSLGKAFEKQTKTIEFNWTRTHKHLVHKTDTQPFSQTGGCGFEFSCSHLNFTFRTCFEQGVP